jgi:filamentous hemagglutinin
VAQAGRDISLDITQDERNHVRTAESAEVGSAITTNGSTVLDAGNDVDIRQGMVSAEGTLAVLAGRDVNVESGSAGRSLDTASYQRSRGFLSSKSTTQRDSTSQTTVVGSSLSGKDMLVSAGNDLTVSGSELAAQDRLSLSAKRDVRIQSAEETASQSSDFAQSKSGFSASVLSGVSHGKSASAQNQTGRSTTQVGSALSGGNVSIDAGRDAQLVASTIVADKDVTVTAGRNIDVLAATDTQTSTDASQDSRRTLGLASGIAPRQTQYGASQGTQRGTGESRTAVTSLISANGGNLTLVAGLDPQYKGTGQGNVHTEGADLLAKDKVTLSGLAVNMDAATSSGDSAHHAESRSVTLGSQLTGIVGSQITRAYDMAQASKTISDSRLQGALELKAGYDAYKLATSGALGAGIADAGAAGTQGDPAGAAFGVSASISSSKSRQDSAERFTTQRGTNIQAGSIDITARETDLNAQGAKLQARDIALDAQRDINLVAVQNTAETHGSNAGSSLGFGVTAGVGSQNGISFQISASRSLGRSNGLETSYDNTLITATDTLQVHSGRDTHLIGAQLAANQVKADIGGNLNIESLQDRSDYESQQSSSGVDMSLCVPPICYGQTVTANLRLSRQSVDHNYRSATGQSGIAAGSGGFDITVKGNTDLKGGALTSTAPIDRNSFTTGSLTSSDLDNRQDTTSRSQSLSLSYGSAGSTASNLANSATATALGNLNSGKGLPRSGSESGRTLSVISASNVKITGTGNAEVDAKSAENVATLTSRDAATANGALVNTLTLQQAQNIPKQQQEAQARQQAAQLVGSVIDNAIGDVSARMGWEEGSAQKVVLHGLAGVVQAKLGDGGALAGMAAGAVNEAVLPAMADYLEGQGIHRYNPDGSVNAEFGALLTAGSTLVGAAVGAVGGDAGLGATVASNATVNNYLKHAELTEKAQEIAACSSDSSCKTEREAYWDKVSQDRNAQIQDSCISGGMQACHMNITQMQVDLAELANSGTGRGLNQYTPEESNNIKQLIEKYRTNLERLASLGQAKESATLISPAMLAAKGYLTQQEAKDLQNLRAGTFIDVAGAVILPGGIKATGKNGANGEGKIAGEIKTPVTSGGTANSAAGIKLAEQLSNESLAASGANMNNIKVVAEGKINGQVYIDTNQTARPIAAANPSEITLTPVDRVATREAQGLGNVNGNMATAHAEIGVIQQASNAGVARGADMTLMVSGERVCGYCRGDIPASAEAAGLKPLTIVDKEAGLTYYWVPGMKNLKVR